MLLYQRSKLFSRLFLYHFYSIKKKYSKKIPFSQTPAFEGVNVKSEYSSLKPLYVPNYFDSVQYKLIRLFSFFGSLLAVGIYIGIFREKNDIDELLETPPSLLYAKITKKNLSERIKLDKLAGKDTSLLEAELEHVTVREAAMRATLEK